MKQTITNAGSYVGLLDLVHRMWNLNQRSHIPSLAGPHTVKNRAATGLRKPSWNVREALTRCSGRDVYVSLYSSTIQCRQRWKPPRNHLQWEEQKEVSPYHEVFQP